MICLYSLSLKPWGTIPMPSWLSYTSGLVASNFHFLMLHHDYKYRLSPSKQEPISYLIIWNIPTPTFWRFPEMGYPQIIRLIFGLSWIFHYKPSSIIQLLGYPHLWTPPFWQLPASGFGLVGPGAATWSHQQILFGQKELLLGFEQGGPWSLQSNTFPHHGLTFLWW